MVWHQSSVYNQNTKPCDSIIGLNHREQKSLETPYVCNRLVLEKVGIDVVEIFIFFNVAKDLVSSLLLLKNAALFILVWMQPLLSVIFYCLIFVL